MERLRLLIIDASSAAALPVLHEVGRAYALEHEHVGSLEALRAALARGPWDLVLSEYALPELALAAVLDQLRWADSDLPCIVVSQTSDQDAAVDALAAGARGFVNKSRLRRLLPAIERELSAAQERRRRALTDSETSACCRALVEAAPEGLWLFDGQERTRYVNPALCRLLEAQPDALRGASLLEFVDDEAKPAAWRVLRQSGEGVRAIAELRIRRRGGSEFWARLSGTALLDEARRNRIGTAIVIADVSAEREERMRLMSHERLALAGTLAAGVAHEINNPLAGVIANLALSTPRLDDLADPAGGNALLAELREQLRDASQAARRVQQIVSDLKLFSRSHEEKSEPVDVRVVLDSVARLASDTVRQRARLVKHFGDVPLVQANPSRLGQVFLNLVTNAAEAIPEGRAGEHEIKLSTATVEGGRVMVEVRDTGAGMPAHILERLFTPFFTTKGVGAGKGLGLSVCQHIVSSLGGEIAVESRAEAGSAFKVLLPALPAARLPSIAPAPATGTRRGRVLAIDDEPMMVRVIQRMLSLDHEVTTSIDAQQALEWIKDGQRYDVILCDLMMPRMSGMEFHVELARIAPEQAQRVIFLTGGAFTPPMRAFLDAVENLRLEKPFEPQSLRAIVGARVAGVVDA